MKSIKQLTGQHVSVGPVRDGEQVGRDFSPPLSQEHPDGGRGVDREPLVRVHHDAEQPGIGLE